MAGPALSWGCTRYGPRPLPTPITLWWVHCCVNKVRWQTRTFLRMELLWEAATLCCGSGLVCWWSCWKTCPDCEELALQKKVLYRSLVLRVLEALFCSWACWQFPFQVYAQSLMVAIISLLTGTVLQSQQWRSISRGLRWSRGLLSGSFLQLSFVRTHSCNLNEQCAKPLKTQLRLSFYCRREKMQS